jgi:hypothetical protein
MDIRIVFHPEVEPLPGTLPSIDFPDPIRPNERVAPDVELGDESKPEEAGRFFFTVSELAARKILAGDSAVYLLWEPEEFRLPMNTGNGGLEMVTMKSVKPHAINGATNLRNPHSAPKKMVPKDPPKEPEEQEKTEDSSDESGKEKAPAPRVVRGPKPGKKGAKK